MQSPCVLHYVVLPTRFGRVFVLMSRDGVVDVMLDAPDAAPSDRFQLLRSRFPNARLMPDDGSRGAWAAAVVARIDGTHPEVAAPVDLAWSAALAPEAMVAPVECARAS